jgi:hypothetical protein
MRSFSISFASDNDIGSSGGLAISTALANLAVLAYAGLL